MQQRLSLVSLGYLCLCPAILLTIILKRFLGSPKKKYHKLQCSFSLQYLLSSTLDSYTNSVFFFHAVAYAARWLPKPVIRSIIHIVSIKHLASTIITFIKWFWLITRRSYYVKSKLLWRVHCMHELVSHKLNFRKHISLSLNNVRKIYYVAQFKLVDNKTSRC